MVLRTRPEDDDWQKVNDAKKRKQIQDRLAQRARRRRLREAKGITKPRQQSSTFSSRNSETESSPANEERHASNLVLTDLRSSSVSENPFSSTSPSWKIAALDNLEYFPDLDSPPTPADFNDADLLPSNLHSLLPSPIDLYISPPITVFTAMFRNGQILSLTCGADIPSKSAPTSPTVPLSLRPTPTQLTTVHFQWIDRLPFPKLRDSLIKLQGVVDLEDFLNDFFVAPSFTIRYGAESWDARAWSMEAGWARKWAWLFF